MNRDLKPENILLDEDMHIQITDFGTAFVEGDDNGKLGTERLLLNGRIEYYISRPL